MRQWGYDPHKLSAPLTSIGSPSSNPFSEVKLTHPLQVQMQVCRVGGGGSKTLKTPLKTNMAMENPPWMNESMYFLLNMGIFQPVILVFKGVNEWWECEKTIILDFHFGWLRMKRRWFSGVLGKYTIHLVKLARDLTRFPPKCSLLKGKSPYFRKNPCWWNILARLSYLLSTSRTSQ